VKLLPKGSEDRIKRAGLAIVSVETYLEKVTWNRVPEAIAIAGDSVSTDRHHTFAIPTTPRGADPAASSRGCPRHG